MTKHEYKKLLEFVERVTNLAVTRLPDTDSDIVWVRSCATADKRGLEQLYRQHAWRAMTVAQRVLHSRSDAEEVVQETFLEVWRNAKQFDEKKGSVASWITAIARNRSIDRLRSQSSRRRATTRLEMEPLPTKDNPLDSAEQRGSRERLQEALNTLPAEQRLSIELAFFEGLTHREISARTGDPLGTVKTRVRLGMEKLATLLGGNQ